MFWQRTLSAAVLIAIVLSGFLFENQFVRYIPIVFLIVIAFFGVSEACVLFGKIGLPARRLLAFLATAGLCLSAGLGQLEHLPLILSVTLLLAFLFEMSRHRDDFSGACESVSGTMLVLLWVGLPLAMGLDLYVSRGLFPPEGANQLSEGVGGRRWLKLLFAVVWSTDSFAYIAGKTLGRHKLTAISPKKTWEGAVGGLLGGGVLIPIVLSLLFPKPYPMSRIGEYILVSCGISILTQFGDLGESLVKRQAGVKDSGHTHTGHGGVLDIIDGLLFAGAGLWCYVWLTDRALLAGF
jgi:CDP-diglyceride synthetase